MKIFIDTEFVNRGAENPIDLISIGMVREDGEEFYGINVEAPLGVMYANRWIRENLWPTLPLAASNGIVDWDHEHPDVQHVRRHDNLREDVYQFIVGEGPAELWGSYSGFDYTVLSQLFGTFNEHRDGVPMFINDVQQALLYARREGLLPRSRMPRQDGTAHHALDDARWVRDVYQWLYMSPQ